MTSEPGEQGPSPQGGRGLLDCRAERPRSRGGRPSSTAPPPRKAGRHRQRPAPCSQIAWDEALCWLKERNGQGWSLLTTSDPPAGCQWPGPCSGTRPGKKTEAAGSARASFSPCGCAGGREGRVCPQHAQGGGSRSLQAGYLHGQILSQRRPSATAGFSSGEPAACGCAPHPGWAGPPNPAGPHALGGPRKRAGGGARPVKPAPELGMPASTGEEGERACRQEQDRACPGTPQPGAGAGLEPASRERRSLVTCALRRPRGHTTQTAGTSATSSPPRRPGAVSGWYLYIKGAVADLSGVSRPEVRNLLPAFRV